MKHVLVTLAALSILAFAGCTISTQSSDTKQAKAQELLLQEATAQTGMPAIKNFRERKLLKDILEMRDQTGLVTYTYLISEQTGKLRYLGESIGYGIPYATQYTNPQKIEASSAQGGYAITAQADPNGLFSPAAAEGTWILLKNPYGADVKPIYVEPRVIVSPFPLAAHLVSAD